MSEEMHPLLNRPFTKEELEVKARAKAEFAKKPIKERLAWKHVQNHYNGWSDDHVNAYLAGFERAKALCIDYVHRCVDEFTDRTPKPSEVLKHIGEGV